MLLVVQASFLLTNILPFALSIIELDVTQTTIRKGLWFLALYRAFREHMEQIASLS